MRIQVSSTPEAQNGGIEVVIDFLEWIDEDGLLSRVGCQDKTIIEPSRIIPGFLFN